MKKALISTILPTLFHLLLVVYFSPALGQLAPQVFDAVKTGEEVGFNSQRLKRLDAWMQSLVNDGLAPNVLSFVARKGKVVHYKAYGYSNIESRTPLKKDDIFRIASQTKAITTTALMILFEEGKFLMEDAISKYIPSFKNPKVLATHDPKTLEYITVPAKREINIRDLLTHTAGIPYDHPLEKRPEFVVPYYCATDKVVLADVVEKIASRPLVSNPGEKYVYGLNSDVVGRLVEVLSGQPLDQYIAKNILQPLGMNDTYFYLPDTKAKRLVTLYSKAKIEDKLTLHTNETYQNYAISGAKTYFSGGAGLLSTIEDYAKFCQMILNGGKFNNRQILGRKTIEFMSRNQIGDLTVWDRNDKFGFGFMNITDQSRYGDLASPQSLTWGGMYCSEYTIDPKEGIIALIFTNVQPYAHYGDFVRKFRILAFQAVE